MCQIMIGVLPKTSPLIQSASNGRLNKLQSTANSKAVVGWARLASLKLRFQTRDQRIKRCYGALKPHIYQRSARLKDMCAIECVIEVE
jgi:hypothetical protein